MTINMLRFPAIVLAFTSALTSLPSQDQQPPAPKAPVTAQKDVLAETTARYGAAEWPRSARRAGLYLGTIALRGYTGGTVENVPAGPRQRLFADENGENRLLLEVFVDDDAAAAGQRLVWWLAHVSKPGLVPTAAEAKIPVGDAAYVGWSKPAERRIAWIAFVRGNVAVRVACLDPSANPHPDLAAVAQAVDAAIALEPVVPAGQPLPRPVIARFVAQRASCRAGDVLPLVVQTTDAAGTVAPHFVIEGPGQGYVEQGADGAWRLHTTGAGKTTVHLHATGVRGLTVTAKLVVDVAERR